MNRRQWLITALGASIAGCGKSGEKPGFQESTRAGINPERGFYVQVGAESKYDFATIRSSGMSLVLLTINLKNFRSRQLSVEDLAHLDSSLKAVREAGLKVIFRAAYGFTDDDYRKDPEDLNLIRQHVWTIGEVLTRHAPVLWSVQAGMLGPWGEWHGSTHGSTPSLEARKVVVDAWLKSLPETVFIQVRRPRFVRDMFPKQGDRHLARVGWHNDALLALPNDMGTYDEAGWDRNRELEWSSARAEVAPFGGETVPASEPTPGEQVAKEAKLLRISYLNSGYHGPTMNGWKETKVDGKNLFATVERSLGYRWVLREKRQTEKGRISLELENTGYAPIYTQRKIEAAWLDPVSFTPVSSIIDTGVSLKGVCPETGRTKIEFHLPKSNADWLLGLRIADPHESLREDGRYAVQLMNDEVKFQESTGWNAIGA